MTMYQLRRLHVSQDPRSVLPDDTVLLYQTTKIGRNPDLVDVVLISSVHSNMISREHTTIYVRTKRDRFVCFIKDHSLNGTYVNDYRVLGETELQQGDVIKFGHVNGAAIKPGCHGPQTSAEFTFVFEEAPPHRLSDRRRPITIYGSTRPQESFPFPSQVFAGDGKNLHPSSRLPLGNPSMEFAASWQNSTAAAAPFYNLQRFPSYYQATFPQLNPAYLQSFWPQHPWSSSPPTTAHQFQHQQLQQQKQVQQYSQLTNQAWIGAGTQTAANTSSVSGGAGDNRLRTVGSERSSPKVAQAATIQTVTSPPNAATAAVPITCCQRSATAATAAATTQPSSSLSRSICTHNRQTSQNFAQCPCPLVNHSASSSIPVTSRNSVALAAPASAIPSAPTAHQQQYSTSTTRSAEAQKISRLPGCSPVQVIATPSALDSVKRMECDSSVPSPPRNQQQQAALAMFGAVPPVVGTVHRTAVATVSQQHSSTHPTNQVQAHPSTPASLAATATAPVGGRKYHNDRIATTASTSCAHTISTAVSNAAVSSNLGIVTTMAPKAQGQVGTLTDGAASQVPVRNSASTSVVPEERSMEDMQRKNAERNSRMSGLEELTEDLLEDCGPPRRALSPTYAETDDVTPKVSKQEESTKKLPSKEERGERSPTPSYKSQKSEHSHLDQSCFPPETSAVAVGQKNEPKKRRKNNEVAMLLNDLTEVAWHHLARKSTNKITAPTQTRKVHDVHDDDENSPSETDESDKPLGKKQLQTKAKKLKSNLTAKNMDFCNTNSSGKKSGRKRGRPKKSISAENVGITKTGKKKGSMKKASSSSSDSSRASDSGSDQEIKKGEGRKLSTISKDQSCTSAAEKIERALDMMRKRQTFPDSDDGSSASSCSSSSTPSPVRRTWGATPQRKTGSATASSGLGKKKTGKGRESRSVKKVSRKHSRKDTFISSASSTKKGRKKKNRSSSSESESSQSSDVEWGKMKPVVTPLPAANAPLVFDEWTYHDPEKQCDASSGCRKPQSESVDWVQCDYCNRWYHMECVSERGVTVENADDFDCGCREANKAS